MVVVLRCRSSVLDQWPIGYANLCLLYLNHSSLGRGLLISAPEVEPLASRRSAAERPMRTSSNVRDAVAVILENLEMLHLSDRATVLGVDALGFLETCIDAFDLIVADPPYGDTALAEAIMARCAAPGGPLAEQGLLVLTGRTRPRDLPRELPEGLRCVRTLTYGDSCVDLLGKRLMAGSEDRNG